MKENGYPIRDLLQDSYQELQQRYENNIKAHESLLFEAVEIKLNKAFNCFERGGLYVLSGAMPQENRGNLIMMSIANISDYESKRKALVFLRTTGIQEWGMQLLSYSSGVSMEKMSMGNFDSKDWRRLAAATGDLAELSVILYEGEYELNDFLDFCRFQHKKGHCFDVAVIDGLTQKETTSLNEKGEVRQTLHDLAKDLHVSIVTSNVTDKGWKKPKLERVL